MNADRGAGSAGPDDDAILAAARDAVPDASAHERRWMNFGLLAWALMAAGVVVFWAVIVAPVLGGEVTEAVVEGASGDRGLVTLWVSFELPDGRVVRGDASGRATTERVTVHYAPDGPATFQTRGMIVGTSLVAALLVTGMAGAALAIVRSRRRVVRAPDRVEEDLHPARRDAVTMVADVRRRENPQGLSWSTVLLFDDHDAERWRYKSRVTRLLPNVRRQTVTVYGRVEPYGFAVVELRDGSLLALPEGLLEPIGRRLGLRRPASSQRRA